MAHCSAILARTRLIPWPSGHVREDEVALFLREGARYDSQQGAASVLRFD